MRFFFSFHRIHLFFRGVYNQTTFDPETTYDADEYVIIDVKEASLQSFYQGETPGRTLTNEIHLLTSVFGVFLRYWIHVMTCYDIFASKIFV